MKGRADMIGVRRFMRRATSLVELTVALGLTSACLVPVVGQFAVRTQYGESQGMESEAVSMASNIMENLLAPTVPFEAIDPGKGSGLTTTHNGISQAGFTDPLYEKLLSDAREGTDRIKFSTRKVKYKVYFFAGRYVDAPNVSGKAPFDEIRDEETGKVTIAEIPDASKELTFSYLPGPYGDRGVTEFWNLDPDFSSKIHDKKIMPQEPSDHLLDMDGFSTVPYRLGAFDRNTPDHRWRAHGDQNAAWKYNDPENYFRIPGWPKSPMPEGSYDIRDKAPEGRRNLRTSLFSVASRTNNPTWGYHPVTRDQKYFGAEKGALMKIVVGVRYKSTVFSGASQKRPVDKEVWLASLKANLEENR